MDPDGSNETELPHWDVKYEVKLFWAPDGSKLVYHNSPPGLSDHEVFTVPLSGTPRANITNNPASDGAPAWSPDGSRIAFQTDRDGDLEIYTMTPTGGSPSRL